MENNWIGIICEGDNILSPKEYCTDCVDIRNKAVLYNPATSIDEYGWLINQFTKLEIINDDDHNDLNSNYNQIEHNNEEISYLRRELEMSQALNHQQQQENHKLQQGIYQLQLKFLIL